MTKQAEFDIYCADRWSKKGCDNHCNTCMWTWIEKKFKEKKCDYSDTLAVDK